MANRIRPGEVLSGLDGGSWNEFADASEFVQGLRNPVSQDLPASALRGGLPVSVKLHSALPANSVIGVVKTMDEATNAQLGAAPVMTSAAPAEGEAFYVTLRHGAEGEEVPAVVLGLVSVQVDIRDEADEVCGVIDDDTEKLESGRGSTPIARKPSGTGVKWAVVQLGGGASASASIIGATAIIKGTVPGSSDIDTSTIAEGTPVVTFGTLAKSTGGGFTAGALLVNLDGTPVFEPDPEFVAPDPQTEPPTLPNMIPAVRNVLNPDYTDFVAGNGIAIGGTLGKQTTGEGESETTIEMFILPRADMRSLPGYAKGTAPTGDDDPDLQTPYHSGGDETFKLDSEDCAAT